MSEANYTNKEIMELHFKGFNDKLDDIRQTLKDQNVNSEKRFVAIETDVANLKTFQTRAMVVWVMATTVLTLAVNKWL